MVVKEVVMVIAVLALLEGLFAAIAPKQIEKMLKFFAKKKTNYFRKIGFVESIIAIIILIFACYFL